MIFLWKEHSFISSTQFKKKLLPKGNKTIVSERYLHLHDDRSIAWNSQDMKNNLKCPSIDEWINKMWCVYTFENYSATTKGILPFATTWIIWGIMPWSKSGKTRYYVIPLICGILRKPYPRIQRTGWGRLAKRQKVTKVQTPAYILSPGESNITNKENTTQSPRTPSFPSFHYYILLVFCSTISFASLNLIYWNIKLPAMCNKKDESHKYNVEQNKLNRKGM